MYNLLDLQYIILWQNFNTQNDVLLYGLDTSNMARKVLPFTGALLFLHSMLHTPILIGSVTAEPYEGKICFEFSFLIICYFNSILWHDYITFDIFS